MPGPPREGPPAVAVVVCTRDRPEMLDETLDVLAGVVRPSDEVVIVDSASTDPRVNEVIRRRGVRSVRADRPGLARARNVGIGATTAPIVAFTDDDCLPSPGWTEAIERAFDDPAIGWVTGRVEAVGDGRDAVTVRTDTGAIRYPRGTDPIPVGHGANMAYRRVALDAIRGFDEMLGAGAPLRSAEDHDAFWRVLEAGWEGRYEPAARVMHRQWRGRRERLRLEFGYGIGSGAFAVKAIKLRHPGGRRLLLDRVWRRGVRQVGVDLGHGYEFGAVAGCVKLAGVIRGAVWAALRPIDEHGFVAR